MNKLHFKLKGALKGIACKFDVPLLLTLTYLRPPVTAFHTHTLSHPNDKVFALPRVYKSNAHLIEKSRSYTSMACRTSVNNSNLKYELSKPYANLSHKYEPFITNGIRKLY